MTLELFKCRPLQDARITRTSCASRHKASLAPPKSGVSPDVRESACRECPIGAAHARGEVPTTWADGSPIELVPVSALGTPRPPMERPKTSPVVQVGGHGARSIRAPRAGAAPIRSGAPPATKPPAPEAAPARTSMDITHKGKTQSIQKWADQVGMSEQALRARIKRGWTEAEAIETPKGELPKRFLEQPTAPQHKAAAKKAAVAKKARKAPPSVEAESAQEVGDWRGALIAVGAAIGLEQRDLGSVEGWHLIAVRRRG